MVFKRGVQRCKNHLITGANGFVGSYVGRELQRLGYSVLAAVRSESAATGLHVDGIETTVVKQTLSAASWTTAAGVEAIFIWQAVPTLCRTSTPIRSRLFVKLMLG